MNHIDIRIGRLNQTGPLFPEFVKDPPAEAQCIAMGILEGGMESGAASTCLYIEDADGSRRWVQISASMFHAMNGALAGAEQRFKEQPL